MSKRKPDEGRYSRVSRRVWGSKDFRALSAPKPNAQTLWLRLLCGPELGIIPGLFEMRESGMAEALGWPLPAFRRCLAEITEKGMATLDKSVGLMWVPKAIHHNAPDNSNIVIGWKVAWKDLPECHVKDTANVYLKAWFVERGTSWVDAWAKVTGNVPLDVGPATDQTRAKRFGKPDSDSETDSETDSHSDGAVVVPGPTPDPPNPTTRIRCPAILPIDADALGALELDVGLPKPVALAFLRSWAATQRADATDLRTLGVWLRCAAKAARGEWHRDKAAMRALVERTAETPADTEAKAARARAALAAADAEADARAKLGTKSPQPGNAADLAGIVAGIG